MELDYGVCAGGVIVGGFDGTTLPESISSRLSKRHLAGVTLFGRNIRDLDGVAALCASARESCVRAGVAHPVLSIDQEGGRVARLGAPFPRVPAMRVLGRLNDLDLTRRTAALLAQMLRAVGLNLDFAPVADVDSNPDNPVIGDRSFARDPAVVAEHVRAFVQSMQSHGVMACAKHFPGHGDTSVDSHLALPRVSHDRARIHAIELVPFREAIAAGVATIMTAHVVFDCLEPGVPATLSHASVTDLLRTELGFGRDGSVAVCLSDDLHMKAVSGSSGIERIAVRAIEAGCDGLLICTDPDSQERARIALAEKAVRDPAFARRLLQASERMLALREAMQKSYAPTTADLGELLESPARREWESLLERRMAGVTG